MSFIIAGSLFRVARLLNVLLFNNNVKIRSGPDLYVYLYQSTERLLENIKKRGRDYEKNITASYLDKIHQGYTTFIKSEPTLNTLIIDVSEYDFVNRPQDYRDVIQRIRKFEGSEIKHTP